MLNKLPSKELARTIAALAIFLISGCAVTPQAETQAMQAELRSQRSRISQLANLSSQAYLTSTEEATCPKILSTKPKVECFSVTIPRSYKGYTAAYLIETDDSTHEQIVAIRGTANMDDVLSDLGTTKTRDPELDVAVHSGFQKFTQAIYDDIKKNHRLNPNYKTITTGHSLGGAAALLLGLYLYVDTSEQYQVAGVYTYGQPKVFDNSGTTSWPFFARRVFRVIDCDDVIPILPTNSSKVNSVVKVSFFASDRLDDYQHMGQSLLLMDRGNFWMPGSIELERSLTRNIEGTIANLVEGQPIDHSISQYILRIRPTVGLAATPLNPATSFPCSRVAPIQPNSAAVPPTHAGPSVSVSR